jgi:uncharacterized protein YjgD (DUF1641 family)
MTDMAHPIRMTAPPRDPRAELLLRLEAAPAEHAEALLSALEVLQGLHDRGVLEFLRGGLGSSEKVLEIAVHAANWPESIRGMRNLILLVKLLGEIDPRQLEGMTRAVPEALTAIGQDPQPPGFWRLFCALWSSHTRRGLQMALVMFENIGRNLGGR